MARWTYTGKPWPPRKGNIAWHVLPRITENEQVKTPTRGHQSPVWPDIIALKKWRILYHSGFLKKEKAKVEKNEDVKREIPRVEFEEFERLNIVPIMGCMF